MTVPGATAATPAAGARVDAGAGPSGGAPRPHWQLRLLGTVQLTRLQPVPGVGEPLTLRAEAGLLARLVLAPRADWTRDAMIESLWPGVAPDVGRNRLRQALASLRRRLRGPAARGDAPPSIDADRLSLRLAAGAFECDVPALAAAWAAGDVATMARLDQGEFMPGHDDEWTQTQRRQLALARERAQDALARASAAPAAADALSTAPRYLSRLVGAEDALARLPVLLRTQRLVTLLGPGGAGKTRLAVELLRHEAAGPGRGFERGLFVSMQDCHDRAAAAAALARRLGLARDDALVEADTLADALAPALGASQALVVFDNLEQLGADAVGWIGSLLRALPRLHLLATSRRPLGLDGEWRWPLAPLATQDEPEAQGGTRPAAAVQLFLDRAAAVTASPPEARDVRPLVQRLGGWPLAIELAATRAASFTPAQMLALLASADDAPGGDADAAPATPHLDLLQRTGAGASPDDRHGSMAAVLSWSWRLLDAPGQRLLAALAQIDGEATATTAAAMLEEPPARIAARLDTLAGQSLLRPVGGGGPPRFALPEPVREFARLHTPPALALRLRAALRRHLVSWAERHARGPLAPVAAELPAVLSAIALASADGVPEDGLRLALALRPYWDSDGHPARLRLALGAALDAAQASQAADPRAVPLVDPALASDAHELLAYLHFEAGQIAQARHHAEAALAVGPDAARRARALARRAWIDLAAARSGHADGPRQRALQAELDDALALARSAGDAEAEARVWQQRGALASEVHADSVTAEQCMARAQALWQQIGDTRKAQARLRNRAQQWIRQGRVDAALAVLIDTERRARADGDWIGRIDSLLSIAHAQRRARRWALALAADREALTLAWNRWHRHALAFGLWGPGLSLARLRRAHDAARVMAFAAGFWRSQYGLPAEQDQRELRRVRRLVVAQIGEAATATAWAQGEALALPEAVALVLAA